MKRKADEMEDRFVAIHRDGNGRMTSFLYEKMSFNPSVVSDPEVYVKRTVPIDGDMDGLMERLDGCSTVEEAKMLVGMFGIAAREFQVRFFPPTIAKSMLKYILDIDRESGLDLEEKEEEDQEEDDAE